MKIAPSVIKHTRNAGYEISDSIDVESATNTALVAVRSAVLKASRSLVSTIGDNASAEEVRKIEDDLDRLRHVSDVIEAELAVRESENNEAQTRSKMRPDHGDVVTSASGFHEVDGPHSTWSDKSGSEVRVLDPKQPFYMGRYQGPSLGECLRALVTGPRNEAERRALAEGTDSTGGFTVPAPLAAIYIDKLRAASVVIKAGAQTVDMTSETLAIARLATDPTMAWRLENAAVNASDPSFERVLLQAKSLMGLVKISRELLDDSINVASMLENAFIQAAALEFDRAALYGNPNDDEPTGIAYTSGINTVSMGTDGAALVGYDDMIDALYELEIDNAPTPTAMVLSPRTNRDIRKLKDGDGTPLVWPADVAAIPRLVTTSMPINETQGSSENASSIILGYFPHLFVGLRNSLRIEVLKERYAENHQYAFVAHMRGDVQLAHKASFCQIKGITPSS